MYQYHGNMINENLLLLYLARKRIPETVRAHIRPLLAGSVPWESLVDAAFAESLAPLVYYNLKDLAEIHLVPQEALQKLKVAYYGNLARNTALFSELHRIMEACDNRNVDTMVLKGAALANTVYGNIALRSMFDIDILVQQKDLSCVRDIMFDLDYIVNTHVKSEEWYSRRHGFHLAPFVHKRKYINVEVHWNVAKKTFDIDINKWWKRAVRVAIDNYEALIPSAEDMLLHLCLHLHHQNYNVGIIKRGMCDIYETLHYYKGSINWALFEEEISLCKMTKPAHAVLHVLKKLYGSEDDSLLHVALDQLDKKFTNILEDKILKSSDFPGPFIQFYATERLWDKVKSLSAIVFPEPEKMAAYYSIPLNSKKLYLWYLLRPFILVLHYWKILSEMYRTRKYSQEV